MVDREAFGKEGDSVSIVKTIWKSHVNRLVIARKSDTHAIVGYAAYLSNERDNSIYLMRIAVRAKCQRHGIGKLLLNHLTQLAQKVSLDVSTDNSRAIGFYTKMGL